MGISTLFVFIFSIIVGDPQVSDGRKYGFLGVLLITLVAYFITTAPDGFTGYMTALLYFVLGNLYALIIGGAYVYVYDNFDTSYRLRAIVSAFMAITIGLLIVLVFHGGFIHKLMEYRQIPINDTGV